MSNITSASGEASVSSGGNIGDDTTVLQQQQLRPVTAAENCTVNNSTLQSPAKRKRKLPGTPDPDAEVIALSPKTLMATNRFICEICNKGFQRDQNLQLHRRGHNLPWKLRQRASTEIRKRVYICPEPTCVHHDPIRALGDLTGIKKHFCRKHGEKKWKCDKCSKRYAVQSDWKAHIKTCGTREYRCDCGTLFSRRDSFITHRAFCDALAEDSTRVSEGITIGGQLLHSQMSSISAGKSSITNPPAISLHGRHLSSRLGESRLSSTNWEKLNSRPARSRPLSLLLGPHHHDQGAEDEIIQGAGNNNAHTILQNQVNATEISPALIFKHGMGQSTKSNNMAQCLLGLSDPDAESQLGAPKTNLAELLPMPMTTSNSGSIYSNNFSTNCGATSQFHGMMNGFSGAMDHIHQLMNNTITSSSGSGSHILIVNTDNHGRTGSGQQHNMIMSSACSSHGAQMSATALLQRAAQMGATASNSPLLNINPGFGMAGLDSSSGASAAALRQCWQDPAAHNQRSESVSNNNHLELSFNPVFNIRGPNIDNHAADVAINPPLGSPYFTATGTGRSSDNTGGLQDLMNSLAAPEAAAASLYLGENLDQGMHEQYGHQDEHDSLLHHSGSSTFLHGGSSSNSTDNYISTQHHHHHHHHNHVHSTVKNISINEVLQGTNNILNPMSGSKQQLPPARTAHGTADQDGGDNLTRDFLGVGVQARANNMVLNSGGDDHAGRIRRSVLFRVLRDRDHPGNINSGSQQLMVGSALMDLDSYDNNNG